ncbi:MAG: 1-deoxy-D-xylulose-5-phosphate synthase, partial [Bacteroidales bacterium]|nr:1-deoxy-D-xylulose-5-phosphate synthase [Bacteroidales bacterium]
MLEKINSPKDIKTLSCEQLDILAADIRKAIINRMSKRGGHLGPNLGMVETTIALHYVFDSPTDKFVFDVSHQCYTHKILTGRKNGFLSDEDFSKISGYTNPEESEHDFFNIGHTSTSVSLASGLAKARDQKGEKGNVIAIIGDGSLSGGEAMEGFDYIGEQQTNFIIVVNDNDMSISENHGGIYKNLRALRESNGNCPCNLFKAFGLDYLYVNEGNNIQKLIEAFQKVKDITHPIVVHINTLKGKGYKLAETHKEEWHWHLPFVIETGEPTIDESGENYVELTAQYLMKKMKADPKVVAIVAGVATNIGFTEERRKEFAAQLVDVGIAEEHGVAMASGMARNGAKPVFATHSSFFQRTYDQISQDLCINNNPATLLVNTASVWGMNDITHLGIFDIPMMSNIPNLVYLAPTCVEEYFAMLDWSIEQTKHPVAVRIPCNGTIHSNKYFAADYSKLNKYETITEGKDIAIIALGDFFQLGESV